MNVEITSNKALVVEIISSPHIDNNYAIDKVGG
jgi:hypothetical protein